MNKKLFDWLWIVETEGKKKEQISNNVYEYLIS